MTIYTHNGPRIYDAQDIRMIVTDVPRSELNISDDWFEVDAEEAELTEKLTGYPYPEYEGLTKLTVMGYKETEIQKWGHA